MATFRLVRSGVLGGLMISRVCQPWCSVNSEIGIKCCFQFHWKKLGTASSHTLCQHFNDQLKRFDSINLIRLNVLRNRIHWQRGDSKCQRFVRTHIN